MTSVKKLAIRGTMWVLVSQFMSYSLRLVSQIVLTRLLVPEIFGLSALIVTLITGLHLFSDVGSGPNIIRHKRGEEPEFLNTAWTLQVIRGGFLWLMTFVLAWPAAQVFKEPQLTYLLPVVGLNAFVSGFGAMAVHTLMRRMDFRRLAIYEVVIHVIKLVVIAIWALVSPTIWAIVAGEMVAVLIKLVWSHRLVPTLRHRFTWDRGVVKELFSFGRWIFISTAVTYLGTQADRLILAYQVPLGSLGIYAAALNVAQMPQRINSTVSRQVTLPAIARYIDLERAELRHKILKNRRLVLLMAMLPVVILVSCGDGLIPLIYPTTGDKDYTAAKWMLPILALGIWPNVLLESIQQSLMALGKPKYQAIGQFLKALFVCVGLPFAVQATGGILGAVIIVALNDLPLYAAISYGLWRERLSGAKQDIEITALLFAILGIILAGRWALGWGLPIDQLFKSAII